MPRSGSGTYSLPAGNPVVTGTVISSTVQNNTMTDIATALTQSIAYDGQTVPIANLAMGTYRHTGVGNGVARTDYAALGQQQDGTVNWVVAGGTADALTATYTPIVTALVDGQIAFVRASATNATTTPTFSPNSLTARTITKLGGTAVVAGEWVNLQELILRYNLANTRWELLNPRKVAPADIGAGTISSAITMAADITMSGSSIIEAEGAAVTAAATTDIWATDGNTVHVTGNTGITSFGTAPQAGAWMKVIFDGAPLLTQSANLNLNAGGANIQIAADDFAMVYADTTTQLDVFVVRKSGAANVIGSGTVAAGSLDGAQTAGPPIFGARAFCTINPSTAGTYTPTLPSGNVTSIQKVGTGKFTVTFITAMPTAEYVPIVSVETPALTLGGAQTLFAMYEITSQTTTTCTFQCYSYVGSTNTPSAYDPTRANLTIFC